MEQSLKYEVEIMLKIADMSMYYGLDNYLKTIITREDELERRYNRDYLDYIALTLLYHQIIEKFLESIVMINNFNIALNMFPQKIEMKMKKKNSFYDLIESVKNSFEFRNKERFVKEVEAFNKLRNKMSHKIIQGKIKNEDIEKQIKSIKSKYHSIQDMYSTISIDFINYVEKEHTYVSKYIDRKEDYSCDIKSLDENNIHKKYSKEAIDAVKNCINVFLASDGKSEIKFHAGEKYCVGL